VCSSDLPDAKTVAAVEDATAAALT